MKNLLILFCLLGSISVYAQDMSKSEKNAYKHNVDGSSTYIGKCTTHEDYLKKYFVVTGTIQEYVETYGLSKEKRTALIKQVGKSRIIEALKIFELDNLGNINDSLEDILKEYVDDITVETIKHKLHPELNLLRFNIGYGGGNGGFLILEEKNNRLQEISLTGDGDLLYCDRSVWLD